MTVANTHDIHAKRASSPFQATLIDLNKSQVELLISFPKKMEAIMSEQSSMHTYLNWTKQRIDEMDATLASLEERVSQVKAESKAKADQMLADMKLQRDEFHAKAKAKVQGGEAAMQASKAQLESQWHGFEARVQTYFDTVGEQFELQQATFWDVAAAQAKTWQEAADKFHSEAAKAAVARRGDVDAAVKQMKADAGEAEARLQKLKQAGSESWAAMSSALTESRNAFDQANLKAWDAIKRATSTAA